MEKWEIDLNIALGYEPIEGSMTRATLEECENWDRVICEHCLKGEALSQGLYTCPGCSRAYHKECVQNKKHAASEDSSTPQDIEADSWVCPECTHFAMKGPAEQEDYKEAIQPWFVQWKPKWEDEDTVLLNPGMLAVIERRLQGQEARGPPIRPATDHHKNNLERQAPTRYTPQSGRTHNTVGEACRKKVKVHLKPVDPEVDIQGTGAYTLQIRPVTRRHRPKEATEGVSLTTEMACIYNPEGHCVGMLTPGRANLLYLNFLHCTQPTHPAVDLCPGTFAEELALLLARYKEGTPIKGRGRTVKLSNHWTTPRPIYECIQGELQGTNKERFASPLNYNPGMREYWSCHERDRLFGAHHDAYSHQWTGLSVANPEYEPKDMEKAVAWAVHSARHNPAPTVTLFILPAWMDESNTAYLRWQRKSPTDCQVVLRIPKRSFRFLPPDHAVAVQDPQAPGHLRWDVTIMAVFNEAGKAKYLAAEEGLRRRLCNTINRTFGLQGAARLTQHWLNHTHPQRPQQAGLAPASHLPTHLMRPPNKVLACPTDAGLPRLPIRSPEQWGCSAPDLRQAFNQVHPLLLDPTTVAYTDGSRVVVDLGDEVRVSTASALYIPEQPGREEVDIGVDPNVTGRDNSINRAELGAVNLAMQLEAHTVLTDSQVTLHQIWKGVAHPADISHLHRHHALVLDTVRRAVDLPVDRVHFYKVKAHVGIPGNERADNTAQDTALGRKASCPQYTIPASNEREDMFWPYIDESETWADGSVHEKYRYTDSLEGALKAHIRGELEQGWANQDSVYFSSLQKQMPRIRGHLLTYLAQTSLLSTAEKRCRWKYLTGTLYTNKRARWYGHSKTDRCPVPGCSSRDSQGHAMGQCTGLLNARIAKHHAQGRIIAKAVSTGNQGNGLEFCFTDLGKKEHWDAEGIPTIHTTQREIPEALIDQHTWQQLGHRPDLLLWRPRTRDPTRPGHTRSPHIHIVEFKNCRDSDPTPVYSLACAQHGALEALLKERHPDAIVETDVILVGMAGTIYEDFTVAPLKRLGVQGSPLQSVLQKLAVCAAQQMHKVWSYRRKLIQQGRGQAQTRMGVG